MRKKVKASLVAVVTIMICSALSCSALADELYYFYDNIGRLTRAVSGTDVQIFNYDKVGNIISTFTGTTTNNPPVLETISPDYLFIGSTVTVVISGRNFLTLKQITSDNASLKCKVLEVSNDEQIIVEITAPTGTSAGTTNITVSNLYGYATIPIFVSELIFAPGQLALTPGSTSSITASIEPVLGKTITLSLTNDNPSVVSIPAEVQIPLSGSVAFNVTALSEGVSTIESLNIRSVIFVTNPFQPEPGETVLKGTGLVSVLIDQPTAVSSSFTAETVSAYIETPSSASSQVVSSRVSAYVEPTSTVSSTIHGGHVSTSIESALGDSTITSPLVSAIINP